MDRLVGLIDARYPVFLAVAALLLALAPEGRPRLGLLVAISYLFYAALSPTYALVLAVVSASAYCGAWVITFVRDPRNRSMWFGIAVLSTLAPLLGFKYVPVFVRLMPSAVPEAWTTLASVILPVGLSFYTFQAVGYLVDVYVGNVNAERDVLRFAAFMSFFPQLLAGPIERGPHLLPQLAEIGRFDLDRAVAGLRALIIGFFMKVVIADTLSPIVDRVYSAPHAFAAADIATATILFSFQVYADFAGYSLIAIGSGRLLGIELLPNFEQPYLSQTLPDFWRTWHMSLSAWFRDYVFTPLHFQARRLGAAGLAAALLVTFALIGAWHGAGWKYVGFGLVHGALVSVSTLTIKARDRWWRRVGVPRALLSVGRVLTTFSVVTLTFVLFRAGDVHDAWWIYQTLFSGTIGRVTLPLRAAAACVLLVVVGDHLARAGWNLSRFPRPARWAVYHCVTVGLIVTVVYRFLVGARHVTQFIYFKF